MTIKPLLNKLYSNVKALLSKLYLDAQSGLRNWTGIQTISLKVLLACTVGMIGWLVFVPLWAYALVGLPMAWYGGYFQYVLYYNERGIPGIIVAVILNWSLWPITVYLHGLRILGWKTEAETYKSMIP